jgi:pyruvate/2-oxoglutarate dehydrogenase complex dihydrolipoamide acyltransferase (E2) component
MAHPILMPKPGQMTEECVLVAWHKQEGDVVKKGDVLFEIETDKSNMDVEAFEEGVLLKRVVQEGETVPVNAVCAYVGEPGEAIPGRPGGGSGCVAAAAAAAAAAARRRRLPAPTACGRCPAAAAPPPAGGTRLRISPRASRLAADSGIDPRTITGTGPEGRITERDVKAALAGGLGGSRARRRRGAQRPHPAVRRPGPGPASRHVRPGPRGRRAAADEPDAPRHRRAAHAQRHDGPAVHGHGRRRHDPRCSPCGPNSRPPAPRSPSPTSSSRPRRKRWRSSRTSTRAPTASRSGRAAASTSGWPSRCPTAWSCR